ncbi:hypothetical protein CPB83DRAFT_940175 [Crepidotus variabilis]|uniref:MYND-type domain-containing protein n=1 Tax=Crepidotus variabilis TaxID=179855 RepID=A0A9P6JML5_9AGAR|nr:hypothetical protein CPB83DRAFT_940175 [Crepidotus variabilis]
MMTYLLDDSRIPDSMKSSERWQEVQEITYTLCYYYLRRALKKYPVSARGSKLIVVHPKLLTAGRVNYYVDIFEDLDRDITNANESRIFFVDALHPLWKRMYCFAPGCPKSIQLVGANFKAYSRCGIARYCGRKCQKADWKGSENHGKHVKHSRVCGLLGRFRQSTLIEGKVNPGEIVLEDESWVLLCRWYKSLVRSVEAEAEDDAPPVQTGWSGIAQSFIQYANTFLPFAVRSVWGGDPDALVSASWEDFIDILMEFMSLANSPTPIMTTL